MATRFNRSSVRKLLGDKEVHPFVLLVIILDYLDEEEQDLSEVNTAVLLKQLEEEYTVNIPEENENRINAVILAVTTDLFFTNVNVMKAITLAFVDGDIGNIPDGEEEEVEVADILRASAEMALITDTPLNDILGSFSSSVDKAIGNIIDSESEDPEDDEEDYLPYEEGEQIDSQRVVPYFYKILDDYMEELEEQLYLLGTMTSLQIEEELVSLGLKPANKTVDNNTVIS